MNLKKRLNLFFYSFLALVLIKDVFAQPRWNPAPFGGFKKIFDKIIEVFTFDFLKNKGYFVAFMKLILFVILFAAIYYSLARFIERRNIAGVISAGISLIAIIFMPAEWIVFIGATFPTLLIVGFVGVLLFIFYMWLPNITIGDGKEGDKEGSKKTLKEIPTFLHFIRFIFLLFLYLLITNIYSNYHYWIQ